MRVGFDKASAKAEQAMEDTVMQTPLVIIILNEETRMKYNQGCLNDSTAHG